MLSVLLHLLLFFFFLLASISFIVPVFNSTKMLFIDI